MDHKPIATGSFPIPLPKALYLIGALVYLQLLYLISYIARPLSNSRREFPPVRQHIDRVEAAIINFIIGAIPLSTYSSATATGQQSRFSQRNGVLDENSGRNSTSLHTSWLQAMPPNNYRFSIHGPNHPPPPPQTHPRPGSSLRHRTQNRLQRPWKHLRNPPALQTGTHLPPPIPNCGITADIWCRAEPESGWPALYVEEQMLREDTAQPVQVLNPFMDEDLPFPVSASVPACIADLFRRPWSGGHGLQWAVEGEGKGSAAWFWSPSCSVWSG